MRIGDTWSSLRGAMREAFSFSEIKDVCGAAGLPIHELSALQQGLSGASKGQLVDAIDSLFTRRSVDERDRIVTHFTTEMLRRKPELNEKISELLARVGWGLQGAEPYPLTLQIDVGLADLPPDVAQSLTNCIRRYRDGDASGAITAICGLVDGLTESIYARRQLGSHRDASYQERVSKSFSAFEDQARSALRAAGLSEDAALKLWSNHRGAVNQAAYVLATYRSTFADVHGWRSAPAQIVQEALTVCVFIARSLIAAERGR